MKSIYFSAFAALSCAISFAGEISLFNGKDLSGWEGAPGLWSVEDGVITGRTTAEKRVSANTFLIWKGGEVADFELTLDYKFTATANYGNSGVQYRSKVVDAEKFIVGGYQADFEFGDTYSGILYEERGRGILAQRGQKVKMTPGANPSQPTLTVTGQTGDSAKIQAAIQKDGWNQYRIVVKGNHIQHFINGHQTVDVVDETPEGAKKGVLALQLHAGPPMQVQFKNITLKQD
jgi:hypothetical protein